MYYAKSLKQQRTKGTRRTMNEQACMNQCSQATENEVCKSCVFANSDELNDEDIERGASLHTKIIDLFPSLNGGW